MAVLGQRDLEWESIASPMLASGKVYPIVELTCRFAPLRFAMKVKPSLVNTQDLKVVRQEKPDRLVGRVCASATIVRHQRYGQEMAVPFLLHISSRNH